MKEYYLAVKDPKNGKAEVYIFKTRKQREDVAYQAMKGGLLIALSQKELAKPTIKQKRKKK